MTVMGDDAHVARQAEELAGLIKGREPKETCARLRAIGSAFAPARRPITPTCRCSSGCARATAASWRSWSGPSPGEGGSRAQAPPGPGPPPPRGPRGATAPPPPAPRWRGAARAEPAAGHVQCACGDGQRDRVAQGQAARQPCGERARHRVARAASVELLEGGRDDLEHLAAGVNDHGIGRARDDDGPGAEGADVRDRLEDPLERALSEPARLEEILVAHLQDVDPPSERRLERFHSDVGDDAGPVGREVSREPPVHVHGQDPGPRRACQDSDAGGQARGQRRAESPSTS